MEVKFPSTRALRAFEAVARFGNLRLAADALCVTPSALSKRIQALESELGQVLFVRDARGLTLTPGGANYAANLRTIFESLSNATKEVKAQLDNTLRISVPPILGHELLKEIKHFESLHPEMSLSISQYSGVWNDACDDDVVIAFGDGKWKNWNSVLLTPGGFSVPMCAPGYLREEVQDVRDLQRYTWIQTEHFDYLWEDWLEAAGCAGLKPVHALKVNSGMLAKQAALGSLGIWMGGAAPHLMPREYYSGELVLAHSFHAFRYEKGYYLARKADRSGDPVASAFCEWLLSRFIVVPEPRA